MVEENKTKYRDEWFNIMENLADSILDSPSDKATDQEEASEVKSVLLSAVQKCRKNRLVDAKKRYKERTQKYSQREYDYPKTPAEKRNLLMSLIQSLDNQSQLQLTAQFRDFKEIPDEDLDGFLKQVYELNPDFDD